MTAPGMQYLGLPLSSQAPQPPFRSDPPLFPELALTLSHSLPSSLSQSLLAVFSTTRTSELLGVALCHLGAAPGGYSIISTPVFVPRKIIQCSVFPKSASATALYQTLLSSRAAGKPATSLEESPAVRRSPDMCVFISLSTFGFFFPSWGKLLLFLTPSQILESSCEQASHQR